VSRRFVKKQQMQWTLRGAHLLLQTRTEVLNKERPLSLVTVVLPRAVYLRLLWGDATGPQAAR
jgi:hypothetical protein